MNHLPVNQRDKENIDKQVDEEGGPEGFAAVADIAEEDAGKQGADGLDFRLTEMEQHEGDHLDEDCAFPEFIFQSKQ